jgi:hypothetical protein
MVLVGNVLFQWDGKSHCKPQGASVGQATAIVEKNLKEMPEIWHVEAYIVIAVILGMVWPCQSQK